MVLGGKGQSLKHTDDGLVKLRTSRKSLVMDNSQHNRADELDMLILLLLADGRNLATVDEIVTEAIHSVREPRQ